MRSLRTPSNITRTLQIPQKARRIELHSPAHLHKGVTYTVPGTLTFIKRLTSIGLQSLHHRFIDWTQPATPSLMLGTVTDLARSKSELVAENALLRKPLIILRRHVQRPACTKTEETVALIKEMARDNRLWGAERIRGELLKLGIHVSKRTIQKYMRHARTPRRRGQTWATFLQNHAKDMWACDALAGHRPLLSLTVRFFSSSNCTHAK